MDASSSRRDMKVAINPEISKALVLQQANGNDAGQAVGAGACLIRFVQTSDVLSPRAGLFRWEQIVTQS